MKEPKFKQLSHEEFYRLCVWMKDKSGEVQSMNYAEAAKLATKEIGVDIKGNQIRRASEATSVALSPVQRAAPKGVTGEVKAILGTLLSQQRMLARITEATCPRAHKNEVEAIQVNAGRLLRELKEL